MTSYTRIDPEKIAAAISTDPDEFVVVRSSFRWMRDGAVISNAYESYSLLQVCDDNRWEIVCEYGDSLAVCKQTMHQRVTSDETRTQELIAERPVVVELHALLDKHFPLVQYDTPQPHDTHGDLREKVVSRVAHLCGRAQSALRQVDEIKKIVGG